MSDEEGYGDGGSGSGEGGSDGDDGSYDYGFADDDDVEGDEEEYDVDYANMNVSPEILRMLGASEEVIAAKRAEISGIAWVAPTATGLDHSSAIADFQDVALGAGGRGESKVKRTYKTVGAFDEDKQDVDRTDNSGDADPPSGHAPGDIKTPAKERSLSLREAAAVSAVVKIKVAAPPQPVPKELEHMLPPTDKVAEEDYDSASDTSWDEASAIDGHGWWETGSDEDIDIDAMRRMSPNLLKALGLASDSEHTNKALHTWEGTAAHREWRPPAYSGLQNSKPLTTLLPLVVSSEKRLEVVEKTERLSKRYSKESASGHRSDGGEGTQEEEEKEEEEEQEEQWGPDVEGWDYEDVPDDDDYLLEWSTNISPNLAAVIDNTAKSASKSKMTSVVVQSLHWRPPTTWGLGNSTPMVKVDGMR